MFQYIDKPPYTNKPATRCRPVKSVSLIVCLIAQTNLNNFLRSTSFEHPTLETSTVSVSDLEKIKEELKSLREAVGRLEHQQTIRLPALPPAASTLEELKSNIDKITDMVGYMILFIQFKF